MGKSQSKLRDCVAVRVASTNHDVCASRTPDSTSVLGEPVSMPVMIAPAALGKLLHPDGEKITVTAARESNVLQV
jgi:isopentenyl diphosphate isomerase/L-lactate dehydrogenase-like FMN-dependent dehydrogenase